MIRKNKIVYMSELFFLKSADLISNMALRIIRETGKAFQPENEFTVLTSQIILSVEEILKYALMALVDRSISDEALDSIEHSSYNYKLYKSSIKDSLPYLQKTNDEAWLKICTALDVLNQIYYDYITNTHNLNQAAIKNQNIDSFVQIQKSLTNKLIIYLNMFDGLCHNTGNIFEHLSRMEAKFKKIKEFDHNLNAINKLFDAKNLKNPYETYEIAKTHVDLPIKLKDVEPLANNSKYRDESFSNRSKNRKDEIDADLLDTRFARTVDSNLQHPYVYDQKLSETFIANHKDDINWTEVCKTQKLSEEFMDRFAIKLNWDYVCERQKFSLKFAEKHIEHMIPYIDCIEENVNLSPELKEEIKTLIVNYNWE